MKIFLSYTTRDARDAQLAARLRRVLPLYGADVFFAPEDLRGGEDWETRLFTEIGSCTHFMVILSAESVKPDGWVKKEMDAAIARRDREPAFVIVPITTGAVEHPFAASSIARTSKTSAHRSTRSRASSGCRCRASARRSCAATRSPRAH
jgi:hypothetical protein